MVEEQENVVPNKDEVVPLKQKAGRAMRNRRRNEGAAEEEEVADSHNASKRAKIDHGEQVK